MLGGYYVLQWVLQHQEAFGMALEGSLMTRRYEFMKINEINYAFFSKKIFCSTFR